MSRYTLFQNDNRVRRESLSSLDPLYIAPTVPAVVQCNDLRELHMVGIRFGNFVQQQNEISGIFENPR